MGDDVYLDKMKLGAVIVQKELSLIEEFNGLTEQIRQRPDFKLILNDLPQYHSCWRTLSELYDFLEHDYVVKLNKKRRLRIREIINKYKKLNKLNFTDLIEAMEIIRKMMSLSKFHNVMRSIDEPTTGLEKIRKKYKLGKYKKNNGDDEEDEGG